MNPRVNRVVLRYYFRHRKPVKVLYMSIEHVMTSARLPNAVIAAIGKKWEKLDSGELNSVTCPWFLDAPPCAKDVHTAPNIISIEMRQQHE